jgi:hypothetical protein
MALANCPALMVTGHIVSVDDQKHAGPRTQSEKLESMLSRGWESRKHEAEIQNDMQVASSLQVILAAVILAASHPCCKSRYAVVSNR